MNETHCKMMLGILYIACSSFVFLNTDASRTRTKRSCVCPTIVGNALCDGKCDGNGTRPNGTCPLGTKCCPVKCPSGVESMCLTPIPPRFHKGRTCPRIVNYGAPKSRSPRSAEKRSASDVNIFDLQPLLVKCESTCDCPIVNRTRQLCCDSMVHGKICLNPVKKQSPGALVFYDPNLNGTRMSKPWKELWDKMLKYQGACCCGGDCIECPNENSFGGCACSSSGGDCQCTCA
ncbi:unnamed protein product [Owenia fusiformis]|uniref:Uncharacterized protein n=1 Tax=Owenia fusiformis TaxID=6347 RepID=A0A8J1Y7X9_OWEFU|nr:unnamed protein product [Owenia fusiformis]